jgi:hypothetical protein
MDRSALNHGSAEAETGLPVHVNAYFGLDNNRRAFKWKGSDQLNDKLARYLIVLLVVIHDKLANHLTIL